MPWATGCTTAARAGARGNGARGGGCHELRFCKGTGARAWISVGGGGVLVLVVGSMVVVVVGCDGGVSIAEYDGCVEGSAGCGHVPE